MIASVISEFVRFTYQQCLVRSRIGFLQLDSVLPPLEWIVNDLIVRALMVIDEMLLVSVMVAVVLLEI